MALLSWTLRNPFEQGIFAITSGTSKLKVIKNDPTLQREGQLQRLLRAVKNKGHLDKDTYERFYPVGSQPARFNGLPKMHKARQPNETPSFLPIISSLGTYNCNLSKFLFRSFRASCLHYMKSTSHQPLGR